MRSLVTGCAGFIGSHLSERLLEEGHEVVGIDCFTDYYSREIKEENLKPSLENGNFTFIEEDILRSDLDFLLEGVDYIFHQAAQAGVRASWGESFSHYTDNNILATQKLLEACKDKGIKKFVYAGSSSVYGDVESLPMRESDLPRPVSPYGVSKLAGDNLCYLYWKNFGVPAVSLRYFTVYGPRQRPDMAFHRFTKALFEGREIEIYGDGRQTRDFTYVEDIVESNLLAMGSSAQGQFFNVGGGSRVSLIEVVKTLEDLTGRKAEIEHVDRQKGDVRDTFASTERAEEELGYSPRVPLEEGLKKFVQWYREKRLGR